MGLSQSTFYDMPSAALKPGELLVRIGAICDEFECCGYRRVKAALRHQGMVVNGKTLAAAHARARPAAQASGGDTG